MNRFTVLGASGFVGRHLVHALRKRGETVITPGREELGELRGSLGDVIYCIGNDKATSQPLAVAEAQVGVLGRLLANISFESFTYLSTTRVYLGAADTDETATLQLFPTDDARLFNITKLAGEDMVREIAGEKARIVRLSNVYGLDPESHYFLPSIIRRALLDGRIAMSIAPDSAKDYIAIEDVVRVLPDIALSECAGVYNLGSGTNTSAALVTDAIAKATGCVVDWKPDAPAVIFAPLSIARLTHEFGFRTQRDLCADLPQLIERYRAVLDVDTARLPQADVMRSGASNIAD